MSDPKDPRARLRIKEQVGERLRQVRLERFGELGGPEMARFLGIPFLSWSNYECGVTIPGEVLLGFLILTDIEPRWLLQGEGARFRSLPSREEVRKPTIECRG